KIRTRINFPLTNFNIEPYMLRSPSDEERKSVRDSTEDQAMTPPYVYNAYAVIRHIGYSSNSGHYKTMVKDPGGGCWREFNDDKVRDFNPDNLRPENALQNEEAYIVFYERVLPS